MTQDNVGEALGHLPSNPEKFEFDSSVASIFPEMARRSIPQYLDFHTAHTSMAAPWLSTDLGSVRVLDVGASCGEFTRCIGEQEGWDKLRNRSISVLSLDAQPAMCSTITQGELSPYTDVLCHDIAQDGPIDKEGATYDIVCASYVLQFIPASRQMVVLHKMLDALRPGGLFLFGHKSTTANSARLYDLAHEEYIRMRVANGYTRAAIRAKTLALQGSMFLMDHQDVLAAISERCSEVQETSRWMMFSTLAAIKR